ncbi:LamG-like jellyroll fold domain-containing protein [Nocardioides sp. 1609]|uniref:LamG-like jellyroll fold domain-containing protein n=1 Tax=Nocardioides sp. 1609 TaxID=2508327 RepID=UPI0010705090|nr:LamG-like jellyroll fold domain-containing protein [Nocardioides sp. 1609]
MTSATAVAPGRVDGGGPTAATRPHPWWAWARLTTICLARAYRGGVLTLIAIAVVPCVLSMSSHVIRSGSMEPSIEVGDVVVAQPLPETGPLPVGRVMIFTNPATGADEQLVHRINERLDDGRYITAGDANEVTDATPVERSMFHDRAILLVPYIGLPVTWVAERDVAPLLFWLSLTMLAFGVASLRVVPRPRSAPDDEDDEDAADGTGSQPTGPAPPPRHRSRRSHAAKPLLSLATAPLVLLVVVASTTVASAGFTDTTKTGPNRWKASTTLYQRYTAAVMADSPQSFYLLDEASGALAADRSGASRTGTFTGLSAYRVPGALPNNPGTAVSINGGTDRMVTGGAVTGGPVTFSMELWFRTATTSGGKMVGFESTRESTSSQYDRHVYMRTNGRITYGRWGFLGGSVVESSAAYNDNQWHHLVVSVTGNGTGLFSSSRAVMYLDGVAVDSGSTSVPGAFSGWWRVGYGSLPIGVGAPAASWTASVDQFAIYPTALSAQRVAAHWNAR